MGCQPSKSSRSVKRMASSCRDISILAEDMLESLKETNISGIKIEGQDGDDWVLVDAGDVVIHLMSADARKFYDLESLWDPEL